MEPIEIHERRLADENAVMDSLSEDGFTYACPLDLIARYNVEDYIWRGFEEMREQQVHGQVR